MPGSRLRRFRARHALLPLLAIPVIATGTATLAANDVAASHAGATEIAIGIPTQLSADTASIRLSSDGLTFHFIDVAALLTTNDSPLAGQPITFTANGVTICTATTQNDGIASCPETTEREVTDFPAEPSSFSATFDGAGPLQKSETVQSLSPERAAVNR